MFLKRIALFLFSLLLPALIFANVADEKERTLSIIKPDAVSTHHIGDIISRFEKEGLEIVAIKMTRLSPNQAAEFYQDLKDKPFYPALQAYMSSGPIVVMILEGKDAIAKNRKIMGATDPKKADQGTLRALFGESIERNAVHGSDSAPSAKKEIAFFFGYNE